MDTQAEVLELKAGLFAGLHQPFLEARSQDNDAIPSMIVSQSLQVV